MRIGIDAHVVGCAKGGAETYCVNLIAALQALGGDDAYTVFVSPAGADLAERMPAENFTYEVVNVENLVAQRFWRLPRRCAALDLDVLHVQRVISPFVGAARVVTIHDVAHSLRPDLFDAREGLALRRLIAMSARRADRVITDSHVSRADIVRLFGVAEDRVAVVPLGVDHRASSSSSSLDRLSEDHGVRPPYLLCVGALETRKNLPRLLAAYARVAADDDAPSLVVTGPERTPGLEGVLRAQVRACGMADRVVITGYVGADTLASLYEHAHAFVFPSLLEGFGLPSLEALSGGIPAAVSDLPVHRELLGDAVLYFDPNETGALVAALRAVVSDDTVRRRLSEAGPHRAARYTWDRTAELTHAAYRAAADVRRGPRPTAGRWSS